MITENAYRLLNKYARKLAKRPQDADDIFQEAMVLFLLNPSKQILSKAFLYTLIKRGAYHLYYNTNTKELLDRDIITEDYTDLMIRLPDEWNLENVYMINEYRRNLRKIDTKKLTEKEKLVFKKVLNDEEIEYSDRTHWDNLKKKIKKLVAI